MEVTNRFKELYLIDRVPEELWVEVHDIVQEAVIKTIPQKERQTVKMLVWGGLTREGLRKEVKLKAKKKRKIYPSECRVPKNSKEIRKPSSLINAKE